MWPWPHGRKGSGHSCPITPFPVSTPRFWGVFLIWIRSLHWVTDFRRGWASTGRILVHGRGSMEGILDFWKPQLCPTPGKQECTPGDGPKLQLIPVPWENRENPSPAGLCTGLVLSPPNSWGLKLICTSDKAQLESGTQNCAPDITQLCVHFIAKKIQPGLAGSLTRGHEISAECSSEFCVFTEVHRAGTSINANLFRII